MTHCGRSGMSDYIRMVHIKNEHSCHGHYSHGCSNIWSHCCGGGTSFMGGVGAGLAYSLVNWAMSGLTNWIGGMGFGGGNWFGGMGWGNVGLGGGNWGFWGLNGANGRDGADGSRSTNSDYYSSRYGSSSRVGGSEGAEGADGKISDIDNAKIAEITEKIANLKTGDVSETDYNTIKDLIGTAKGATDEINKDSDIKTYDKLLDLLDNKKNGNVKPEGATVTISGKPVFIKDLERGQVEALSKEQIDEVVTGNNAKDIAIQILIEAGALANKDDKDIDATTNFAILYLAQKAEVKLKCGHNEQLDNITGALPYIHGTITNVELTGENENAKITFTVNDEKGTHNFECKPGSNEYKLISSTCEEYKTNANNVIYRLGDGYATRVGDAALTKKPGHGV